MNRVANTLGIVLCLLTIVALIVWLLLHDPDPRGDDFLKVAWVICIWAMLLGFFWKRRDGKPPGQ